MTTPAIGAEFAIVNVVRAMTVAATAIDGFHLDQRHAVTVVARDLDMGTIEREVCLQVVIEGPDVPGDRVVTGIAAIREIAFMRVVVAVAGNTVNRFVGVSLGRVAAVTFLLFVDAV